MEIEKLINELKHIMESYGNINVQLQDDGSRNKDGIIAGHTIFIVPEEYEGGEMVCNLRWWPY